MSDYNLNIDSLGTDLETLAGKLEKGEFDAYVITYLEGLSQSEIEGLKEKVLAEFEEKAAKLKDMEDGIEDKIDQAEDDENGAKVKSLERELEDLEGLYDYLKTDFVTAIQEAIQGFTAKNIQTDEDLSVNINDYTNGDHLKIEATAGTVGVFDDEEKDASTAPEDLDGDGYRTYRDEELRLSEEKSTTFEDNQDVFINGGQIKGVKYSDGVALITLFNPSRNETITIELSGLDKGKVHVYFDSDEAGYVSESEYSKWPEEFQKIAFFGDDPNSIHENLNPIEAADKLSFVEDFDLIANDENFNNVFPLYTSGSDESLVKTNTMDVLADLFNWYNEPSGTSPQEAWSNAYQRISTLPQGLQEDVLLSAVMMLAMEGGETYFKDLIGTQVVSIEDIFLKDGKLGKNEKLAILMMELNGGGEGGIFGGEAFFSTDAVTRQVLESDGVITNGQVFGINTAGSPVIVSEYWSDVTDTKEAVILYQEACTKTKWITQDAAVREFAETTLTEMEEKVGQAEVITAEIAAGVEKAIANVNPDDAKNFLGTDGIDKGPYVSEVVSALTYALTSGASVAAVWSAMLNYIQNTIKDSHDGDIMSGVIYYLNKYCPDLLAAILRLDGAKSTCKQLLAGEDTQNATRIQEAYDILEKY